MSSISSISSLFASSGIQSGQQPSFRDLLKELGKSLASGDIAGAQKALDGLSNITAKRQAANGGASNPVADSISQISSDLESGDIEQAKEDFSSLQDTLRAQKPGGAGDCKECDSHDSASGDDVISSIIASIQSFIINIENSAGNESASFTDNLNNESSSNNLPQGLQDSLQKFLSALQDNSRSGNSLYSNNGSISISFTSVSAQFISINA